MQHKRETLPFNPSSRLKPSARVKPMPRRNIQQQAPVPQAPVIQAPVPQAPVPQAPVPQAPVPQAQVHQSQVHQSQVHPSQVHQSQVHPSQVHPSHFYQGPVHLYTPTTEVLGVQYKSNSVHETALHVTPGVVHDLRISDQYSTVEELSMYSSNYVESISTTGVQNTFATGMQNGSPIFIPSQVPSLAPDVYGSPVPGYGLSIAEMQRVPYELTPVCETGVPIFQGEVYTPNEIRMNEDDIFIHPYVQTLYEPVVQNNSATVIQNETQMYYPSEVHNLVADIPNSLVMGTQMVVVPPEQYSLL